MKNILLYIVIANICEKKMMYREIKYVIIEMYMINVNRCGFEILINMRCKVINSNMLHQECHILYHVLLMEALSFRFRFTIQNSGSNQTTFSPAYMSH